VVVESANYFEVVNDIDAALKTCATNVRRQRATPLLRWPTTLFTLLAGGSADRLVARQLTELRAKNLEILLHPSDLVIRGREPEESRAYACLRERLAFTKAYFTWSQEARQMEDQLNTIAHQIDQASGDEVAHRLHVLHELHQQVEALGLRTDEWDVLAREMLQVECKLLRRLVQEAGADKITCGGTGSESALSLQAGRQAIRPLSFSS
jgi:hypothetical protein